jgi:hypothetical protein
MNILPKLRTVLIVTAIVYGFSNCSKPIEEKIYDAESKVDERQSDLIEARKELYEVAADSANQVEQYLIVSRERLESNAKILEEMKREFTSDRSDLKLEYEGRLATLNKKNVELMAITNDSRTIRSDTWENVRIELNKEMDELEKSIAVLRQRQ